jgi:hypothetical protein
MRNVHVWKTVTAEGEKKEIRAERFAGKWRFQAKVKSAEQWTYYDQPSVDELEQLRDVLWRKYQRKRLPHDDVASIDGWLAKLKAGAGGPG